MRRTHLATIIVATSVALAVLAPAAHADQLEVSFATKPTINPRYAPRNVLAVWIEDSAGNFVSTLMRYGNRRVGYLRAWNAVATDKSRISGMSDVITGATRQGHGTLTARWDFKDPDGFEVPDGQYTVRMELTDHNSTSAASNNEGTVSFTKNGSSLEQSGMSSGGFDNISVFYVASAVDPGNPGDPAAVDCSSVIECIPNDGCCLPDCVFEVDSDCNPNTARTPAAGCSAGAGSASGWASLTLLSLMALVAFRPTRCRWRLVSRRQR